MENSPIFTCLSTCTVVFQRNEGAVTSRENALQTLIEDVKMYLKIYTGHWHFESHMLLLVYWYVPERYFGVDGRFQICRLSANQHFDTNLEHVKTKEYIFNQ